MIGKKLTKLLAALDPTEFRRMRKLFQSPIYTSNVHHLKLYDYIRKYYPIFESPRLEKEIVFEKVYGGQAFDDWKLRGLVTEFTRLTEEYFILLDTRKNNFQRKRQLTKIYGERNLYDFFEKGTKGLLADLEASPYRDMDYYRQRAELNEAWYFHPMKNKYDLKDGSLEGLMGSLDGYFILAKMRYGIAMKNVERLFAKPAEIRFLQAVEQEGTTGFGKEESVFQLYSKSFKLLNEQKSEHFEFIEELFFRDLEILNPNDRQIIFFNAVNFINRQMNKGQSNFIQKAFLWYKFGLEHQLFFENGMMSDIIFGNIVMTGCRAKEFDWTKGFIDTYQSRLNSEVKEEAVTYNLGMWHYFQGHYNESFAILSGFSFSSAHVLRSRVAIVRNLFELFLRDTAYYEVLIAHLDSFEIYILRNKYFSKTRLTPHLNFIRLLKKLAHKLIKLESKTAVAQWLQNRLNSSKNIGGKKWLSEKLEDLKEKRTAF